jgi:hypothetical protein
MVKRREIQVLRRAGHTKAQVAELVGVLVGTARRVAPRVVDGREYDPTLARDRRAAVVTEGRSRILHRRYAHRRLLRLDGASVRTLHVNLDEAMKADSDQRPTLIRVSGNSWSDFPEPTDGAG